MSNAKPLLIGDKWVKGGGDPLVSIDPATGNTNCRVTTALGSDIEAAVTTAREALTTSGWHSLLPHRRADHLHRIARLVDEHADDLAKLAMHENGKTLRECTAQAKQAAGIFRYYASLTETQESELTPSRGDYLSMTIYEPFGIVAAITPWNSPINIAAEKLAPALAAGNAVIMKPSELTSVVTLEIGKLCTEAGLPPGLISVLPGKSEVSAALIRHPGVNMVSFTGGTVAGRAIASVAAERLIPVLLELGGKSPNIVFGDADIDLAAAGVVAGIFGSLGQSCIAGSRLFVHESIRDAFVEKIVEHAASIRLGLPDLEDTQLGPLASFAHRDRIHKMVSDALTLGARALIGGGPPQGVQFSAGAYYAPTIIDSITNNSTICQQEIFGPVLCVLPFSDEKDLITQANDTVYGLACGIWTRDFQRAWRIARTIQAGNIWINTYRQNSIATPFGGYKQSGLGRERGPQGLRQYQHVKAIYIATEAKPLSLLR